MQTFIRAFDTTLAPFLAAVMPGTFRATGIVEYYRPIEAGIGVAF